MIYPPCAEHRVPEEKINEFLPIDWAAQPKMNGTAMLVIGHHGDIVTMNRHGKIYSTKITKQEFKSIFPEVNNFVLCGEYMNKAQADESGQPWRDKFVIWDLISFDGEDLVGKTLIERLDILGQNCIDGRASSRPYLCRELTDNISVIKTFGTGFENAYKLSSIPMIEGIILKRKYAKLKPFLRPDNNTDWQVKIRKGTKCYSF